ncbi:c-type cytochrome [Caldimonas sp. KR1-144]|uniref:c-type cytochrome n=1 Tax=Caldimonas sp. KR1-144 TaxID=3400911 RepID=UPI003C070011
MRRWLIGIASVVALLLGAVLAAIAWQLRDEPEEAAAPTFISSPALIARGAYLARAGNCAGCHTTRGGAAYAGGRGIATPFGTIYAPNLTPDPTHGLGGWSSAQFWRAMHHGRARDGRLLYPAFPYPSFTQVTREDSDAIYAFLLSLPPVAQPNRAHELRFPYDTQAALALWRTLFFRPGVHEPQPDKSAQWNRGSYLVRGLGHCVACHANRNLLGATSESVELSGGLIPMQNWYAPSLASREEASVADWPLEDVVDLLRAGTTSRGAVMGPMAEVVFRSTQHLSDEDLTAMAVFLKDLPQAKPPKHDPPEIDASILARGKRIYDDRCAQCHGEQGQGVPGAYPPLAGNRGVTMSSGANVVQAIVLGGFAPATRGNPRPYGMPPIGLEYGDADIAAVATYVRNAWGNQAPQVLPLQVMRARGVQAGGE